MGKLLLTVFLLAGSAAPAPAQFTLPGDGFGGGEGDPPAAEDSAEPSEKSEPSGPSVETGAFAADWPLPPAGQIDGEIRQFTARYGGMYDVRTRDRLTLIDQVQQGGGAQTLAYRLYVPPDYDPGRPAGVMVHVPANDEPAGPGPYKEVLADRNLIWIGPAEVGNKQDVPWREWAAIHAAREVQNRYAVDPDRIYVSGFSGGGRVASRVAVVGSDFFDGGFYFCGVNHYGRVPAGDGKNWDGFWDRPDPALLRRAMQAGRFVLFTGSEDFNLDNTRRVFEQARQDGFGMVAYLEKPGHGHQQPDADYFRRGVALLDSPLVAAAAETAGRAAKLEPRRPGEALALYDRAAAHGSLDGDASAAAARADELRGRLAEAVAAVESAVDAGDRRAAAAALRDLRRWTPAADAEVERLTAAIRGM